MPVCPLSEVHPLLGVKGDGKSKKKQAGRPKGSKGKEKDSPFKPKLYKGDRGLPLEASAKGKVQAELGQPPTGKDAGSAVRLAVWPRFVQPLTPWDCSVFPPSPLPVATFSGFGLLKGRRDQTWLRAVTLHLGSTNRLQGVHIPPVLYAEYWVNMFVGKMPVPVI